MATRGVPAQIRVDINACSPMHVLSQNNVAGRSLQPSQASIQIPRRTSSVLAAFACSRSNNKLCRCLACSRAPSGGQLSKHSNKPKSFNKPGSSSRQRPSDEDVKCTAVRVTSTSEFTDSHTTLKSGFLATRPQGLNVAKRLLLCESIVNSRGEVIRASANKSDAIAERKASAAERTMKLRAAVAKKHEDYKQAQQNKQRHASSARDAASEPLQTKSDVTPQAATPQAATPQAATPQAAPAEEPYTYFTEVSDEDDTDTEEPAVVAAPTIDAAIEKSRAPAAAVANEGADDLEKEAASALQAGQQSDPVNDDKQKFDPTGTEAEQQEAAKQAEITKKVKEIRAAKAAKLEFTASHFKAIELDEGPSEAEQAAADRNTQAMEMESTRRKVRLLKERKAAKQREIQAVIAAMQQESQALKDEQEREKMIQGESEADASELERTTAAAVRSQVQRWKEAKARRIAEDSRALEESREEARQEIARQEAQARADYYESEAASRAAAKVQIQARRKAKADKIAKADAWHAENLQNIQQQSEDQLQEEQANAQHMEEAVLAALRIQVREVKEAKRQKQAEQAAWLADIVAQIQRREAEAAEAAAAAEVAAAAAAAAAKTIAESDGSPPQQGGDTQADETALNTGSTTTHNESVSITGELLDVEHDGLGPDFDTSVLSAPFTSTGDEGSVGGVFEGGGGFGDESGV